MPFAHFSGMVWTKCDCLDPGRDEWRLLHALARKVRK